MPRARLRLSSTRVLVGLLALLAAAPATADARHHRHRRHARHTHHARQAQNAAPRLFAPTSVWNTPLAPDAQLDPASPALVDRLAGEVAREVAAHTGPGLGAAARAPLYQVGADVPLTPVVLDTGAWAGDLKQILARGVPVPAGAVPGNGSDESMVVYQPATDTMWEFFLMQQALHFPRPAGTPRAIAGGTLAPGGYHYWVTTTNEHGETNGGRAGIVAKVTVPGSSVRFSWSPIDDATGYRVYRGADAAHAGLLASLPAGTTTFVDDGSAAPGDAILPTANTAATPGQWRAGFGGRITSVSTSPGYYRDLFGTAGDALERYLWGATATSLPLAAGMVTKADLARGAIDHVLALGLPNLSPASSIIAKGRWAFPAQRSDGKSPLPDAIPEGARLRLDPHLDLDSLTMAPFTRMVAEAAQRYGIIVQDGSAATLFYGEDPRPYMRAGEPNFYDQVIGPRKPGFLADFPWTHLQVMKMSLCTAPALPCT